MPGIPDGYDKKELYKCLQCAICTGSCPVSRVIDGFNPREMVLNYILNDEQEEVLETEMIWYCTTCQICSERCPHEIDISGLIIHIMNHAAERRNIPGPLQKQVAQIAGTGRAIAPTLRSKRRREEIGLKPPKEPDTGEIQNILSATGIADIQGDCE
jgi:heterodisulfide reductase subunit C